MATQTRVIKTRIQNKFDTFNKWSTENPKPLLGEIAIVKIETEQQLIDITGKTGKVPAYLIKVGDGENYFTDLPWLQADTGLSAWTKNEKAEDVSVAILDETETKTLKEWFEYINNKQIEQDAAIATNTAKLTGHTDTAINTLITNKLDLLDYTTTGTGVVKKVDQINGKIEVVKEALTINEIPELPASKITVTTGTTLAKKLTDIATEIADINTAIAGGVHFVGVAITPENLINSLTTQTITLEGGKTHKAIDGDVIIQGEKEFIWIEDSWKELGDLTRIGVLETKLANLDYADTAATNQFVTEVDQIDGKISVTRRQPLSDDIKHGNSSTVATELSNHVTRIASVEGKLGGITSVSTSIADAINALDVSEPTASGTSTSFIKTAKQENGKIVISKADLPTGSTTTKGIVKLNDTLVSTSTEEAATANAIKTVNTVATEAKNRVNSIETAYMRIESTTDTMRLGKDGKDDIIFDCGGAPITT